MATDEPFSFNNTHAQKSVATTNHIHRQRRLIIQPTLCCGNSGNRQATMS
jgi:hypothetical protein